MRVIEVSMERHRNEGEGKREIPRKPADQRHRPARFPHVEIKRATPPGIEPDITAGNLANEVFVVGTLHQQDVQRWGRAIRRHVSSHQPTTSWTRLLRILYNDPQTWHSDSHVQLHQNGQADHYIGTTWYPLQPMERPPTVMVTYSPGKSGKCSHLSVQLLDSIAFCEQWKVCWSMDSAPPTVERLPRKQEFSEYDDDPTQMWYDALHVGLAAALDKYGMLHDCFHALLITPASCREVIKDSANCTGKKDRGRNGNKSVRYGPIPAFVWSDFVKPWKTEIRMAGQGFEPGSSRMRVQWVGYYCTTSLGKQRPIEEEKTKAGRAHVRAEEALSKKYEQPILRANEYELRWVWSSGMEGRGKREISEKTHRPAASSGTIPTSVNPGVARPRIEPRSP
ncbi:hypothetical protein PR048_001167 [Dryococelus australis]|uniref:Uncharacterized protein n=1 Tax=Dryococelus australis TaxID=614101 RepID=A0ABQ9IGQ8_9NEOP|nr:hypothetical protein PR048_001167 [Dryococelus australis]